jgi:predicted homoserine dehydrogenase-like protein
VGIIGTGKFGAGLVAQISQMRGMVTAAIADINLDRARYAYTASRVPAEEIRAVNTLDTLNQAIREGRPAVTEDGLLLTRSDLIDVIVEATGVPEVGARMAYHALSNHKHLVMVNVEADVTVGPFLRRLADTAGVVYTAVDGDQPGCIMNMVDWAATLWASPIPSPNASASTRRRSTAGQST